MTNTDKDRGRKNISTPDSTKLSNKYSLPILGTKVITTLLAFLPALFYSCTDKDIDSQTHDTPMIRLQSSYGAAYSQHIDIFTFNDDALMRLDSYQRFSNATSLSPVFPIRSQNGAKKVFVCVNSRKDKYDWTEINSYWSLRGMTISLTEEQRSAPSMSGEGYFDTESTRWCSISLTPFLSEIHLRTIKCDFMGKPYSGESVRNVRVYLTNINASCPMNIDGPVLPLHIINTGYLDEDALSEFKEPDLIMQHIPGTIGEYPANVDIRLMCYPNESPEEGPGTPFTRLVIEGEVQGETCWWPININREEGCDSPGISRNCIYSYDITLKSKGSGNPDVVIESEEVEMLMKIEPWVEKEGYSVGF